MTADPKLGATGEFPDGKIRPDDEGGLNAAITKDDKGNVLIDFGKPVTWLAMPKQDAIRLALLLLRHAGITVEIKDG